VIRKQFYSKLEPVTDGVLLRPTLGHLPSLLNVNGLPNTISDISNPVLYGDDASLIIPNSDSQMFEEDTNTATLQLNRWFKSNSLFSNSEKNYFLQF
jgi:hypothetical protein